MYPHLAILQALVLYHSLNEWWAIFLRIIFVGLFQQWYTVVVALFLERMESEIKKMDLNKSTSNLQLPCGAFSQHTKESTEQRDILTLLSLPLYCLQTTPALFLISMVRSAILGLSIFSVTLIWLKLWVKVKTENKHHYSPLHIF